MYHLIAYVSSDLISLRVKIGLARAFAIDHSRTWLCWSFRRVWKNHSNSVETHFEFIRTYSDFVKISTFGVNNNYLHYIGQDWFLFSFIYTPSVLEWITFVHFSKKPYHRWELPKLNKWWVDSHLYFSRRLLVLEPTWNADGNMPVSVLTMTCHLVFNQDILMWNRCDSWLVCIIFYFYFFGGSQKKSSMMYCIIWNPRAYGAKLVYLYAVA